MSSQNLKLSLEGVLKNKNEFNKNWQTEEGKEGLRV